MGRDGRWSMVAALTGLTAAARQACDQGASPMINGASKHDIQQWTEALDLQRRISVGQRNPPKRAMPAVEFNVSGDHGT